MEDQAYWYRELLTMLHEYPDADYKSIVMSVAAEHPEIVVKAFRSSGYATLQHKAHCAVIGDNKVDDVKAVRIVTGWGLIEAKRFVESLPTTAYYRGDTDGKEENYMGC